MNEKKSYFPLASTPALYSVFCITVAHEQLGTGEVQLEQKSHLGAKTGEEYLYTQIKLK